MLEHAYLKLISGETRGPIASAARGVLSLAEIPYRMAMRGRNRRYDRRASSPNRDTVSVGNITAGGTGKTPVVEWLSRQLQQAGHHPAILMRGYSKSGDTFSDEQAMLAAALPGVEVIAHPDRLEGANIARDQRPETTCFILDDGFQHRRFARDFDLVLINANQPFGFGHVHPRGLLREPLDGLKRASAILITHASEVSPEELLRTQESIRRYTSAPIFHCDHINGEIVSSTGETREINDLATIPFYVFAGIGQPQSLVRSLQRYVSAYKGRRLFDDHHQYTAADVEELCATCRNLGAAALLTTEKDWVKLKPLWNQAASPTLYRLRLQIRFWEEEERPLLSLIAVALNSPR